MKVGRWYRVSGDSPDLGLRPTPPGTQYLEDNDPARDPALNRPTSLRERARRALGRGWSGPWTGRVGFSSITEAWNGAVYASRIGRSGAMVIFGGGHDDYFGSDVHAFDLSCRRWRRLSDGFVFGNTNEYGQGAIYPNSVYPDGSPLPPHTYDYVQYDDVRNVLILAKGQTELGPEVKAIAIPHLFDLDSFAWRHGPEQPQAILNSGGFSTWDPRRRVIWVHSGDAGGGNAFIGYCPDGTNPDGSVGHWLKKIGNKLPGKANHCSMQYHPTRDLIYVAVHGWDSLAVIDPSDPGAPIVRCSSGGAVPVIRKYSALEYAPKCDSLIYYSAVDGARVYAADCREEIQWRVVSAGKSLNPAVDAAAQSRYYVNIDHTFGRFRIAHFEGEDLAILVRHVDSPVYAMRIC